MDLTGLELKLNVMNLCVDGPYNGSESPTYTLRKDTSEGYIISDLDGWTTTYEELGEAVCALVIIAGYFVGK